MRQARSTCRIVLTALVIGAMAGLAEAQPYVYALGWAPAPDIVSQQLTVIIAATNAVAARIKLGDSQFPRSEDLAITPDGARLYAINSLDSTISVVSAQTGTVLETWTDSVTGTLNPSGVAVSPDSRRVYVTATQFIANRFQAFVNVIDVGSRAVVGTIPLGFEYAYGVAASPDGSHLYVVTGTSANAVAVVSTATNTVITTVPLREAVQSTSVSLSADGRFAYLPRQATASGTPGVVQVLDTSTNTIVATTTVGVGPRQVAASPDGATVYAPSAQSGQVHRLDPSTHAAEGATTAPSALGVAFLPDGSRAYVAAGVNIFVIDTATHGVIGTIPVPVSHGGRNIVAGALAIVASPPPFVPPGSTPTDLRLAAITGNRVTLTWTAPANIAPTGYVVEGGVAPRQVLGSLATGSTATTYTFDAPTGAFYVRVHALTASGRSAASNEIRITVNLPQVPSAPTDLLGLANGLNLALSWKPPATGGPASAYVLDVSGASTLSVPLPLGETFSFAGVPPGTYTFAVRAVNVTGASPPSSPVTLVFPSACPGPPQEPANFAVSRAGSQLTVRWDPPSAGPAVASYVLRVTGTLNLTLPLATRTVSGLVPPGTYNLSVFAVNPCGSGMETVPQPVTVP